MEFFNDKEDVLDIQLTQYGKYIYSKGKFKPVYYSFMDDDILYDGLYANVNEQQNNIEPRIQEETPRLKAQTVYQSTDSLNKLSIIDKINSDSYLNKFINLINNSNLGEQLNPRWTITNLGTSFDTIQPYYTSSNTEIFKIPQLNTTILAKDLVYYLQTSIEESNIVNNTGELRDLNPNFYWNIENGGIFEDQSVFDVRIENTVIKVEESNSESVFDSFEIKVYEVITNPDLSETYKPLSFAISNNIDNIDPQSTTDLEITSDNVEYYFNIQTDSNINTDIVCSKILTGRDKVDEIFKDFDICKSSNVSIGNSIYSVNITDVQEETC